MIVDTDPRLLPVRRLAGGTTPRAWIESARVLHALLIEALEAAAPANVIVRGRRLPGPDGGPVAEATGIEPEAVTPTSLATRIRAVDAWLLVVEPQLLDATSLAAVAEAARQPDLAVVAITTPGPIDPVMSELRDLVSSHDRRFGQPWLTEDDVERWFEQILGEAPSDELLTEVVSRTGLRSHLVVPLVDSIARAELQLPGSASAASRTVPEPVATMVDEATALLASEDAHRARLGAVTGLTIPRADRTELCAAGLCDQAGAIAPVVADAIVERLDAADRRRLAADVVGLARAGELDDDGAVRSLLTLGVAPPGSEELVVGVAERWLGSDPHRSLRALELVDAGSATEMTMRAHACAGMMTRAIELADRLLRAGGSPTAGLVTGAGMAAAARFGPAAAEYRRADPDNRLGIGAHRLAAPVLAGIVQPVDIADDHSQGVTAAAVGAFAAGGTALLSDTDSAIDRLRDACELVGTVDTTLWPDTPHLLAATALTLRHRHSEALDLVDRALAVGAGGAPHRWRLRLAGGWVSLRQGAWKRAEEVITEVEDAPVSLRDRLSVTALRIALARRAGDMEGLTGRLQTATTLMLQHPLDLTSLPAYLELAIATARSGATQRAAALFDQLEAFTRPLPTDPWRRVVGWGHVVAGLATSSSDLATRGVALIDGGPLAGPAGVAADVGTGAAEVDDVLAACDVLLELGEVHEASLLAGAAALGRSTSEGRPLLTAASQLRSRLPGRGLDSASGLGALSDREREVAVLLVGGHTYKEIGEQLFISAKTVEHHVAHIKTKLGAASRAEMISTLRSGLDAA